MRSGCVAGSPPSTSGIVEMVRTFSVTSSPVRPSPRVAARDQPALLVQQRDGQPVDLQLAQVVQIAASDSRSRCTPARPGGDVLVGERVVQREHPLDVADRARTPSRTCRPPAASASPACAAPGARPPAPAARAAARRTPCPTTRARRGCSTRTGPPRSGRPARPAVPGVGGDLPVSADALTGAGCVVAHLHILSRTAHTALRRRHCSAASQDPSSADRRPDPGTVPHTSTPPTASTAPVANSGTERGGHDDLRRLAVDVPRADGLRRDDGVPHARGVGPGGVGLARTGRGRPSCRSGWSRRCRCSR